MDEQELERRREEARAAGYTDEQIDAYLSGRFQRVDRVPEGIQDRTSEATTTAAIGVGQAVSGAAVPVAIAYGAKKAYDIYRNRPPTPPAPAAPAPTTTFTGPSANPVAGEWNQRLARPYQAAPAAPAPVAGDSMAQRVRQIAMEKIVNPVARNAGTLARTGMGALAMTTPGNIGQDYPFPMSGPLRGSEINPNTGRPWTRPELEQYYQQMR